MQVLLGVKDFIPAPQFKTFPPNSDNLVHFFIFYSFVWWSLDSSQNSVCLHQSGFANKVPDCKHMEAPDAQKQESVVTAELDVCRRQRRLGRLFMGATHRLGSTALPAILFLRLWYYCPQFKRKTEISIEIPWWFNPNKPYRSNKIIKQPSSFYFVSVQIENLCEKKL